jgi:hypothetical protein
MRRSQDNQQRRAARLLVALACLCLAALPSRALARSLAASCALVKIRSPKPLPERWTHALDQLCAVLADRGDLDPDAQLTLSAQPDGGLMLHLEIADGRSAERTVRTTASLARSVEALLVLPERGLTTAQTQAQTPPTPPRAAPAAPPPTAAARPQRPLHVKLGLSVIGHVAGVPAYIGGGFSLQAGLRLYSLFFEVAPQWEAQQVSARERLADFEMHNFGVSSVVGLRVWDTPEGALEVALGGLILLQDQSYRPDVEEIGGSLIDGQLIAFVRLLWGHSDFRWSVRMDVIIAPARLAHEARIRDIFPPLPSFAVGVSFGVHWEST